MNESINLQLLLDSIQKKPLVLFVGAGINCPRVPTWNQMLDGILHKVLSMKFSIDNLNAGQLSALLKWHANALTVYEKASLVKIISGKQYHYFLKDILYKNAGVSPGETFVQAAALCRSGRVQAVVSYNYDDYLIREVAGFRQTFLGGSVFPSPYAARPAPGAAGPLAAGTGLPFYFVHGYIPGNANSTYLEKTDIVLSADEYFNIMLDPYSWQTTSQVHFLRNSTCLFIGTSLSDWNMLRLIQTANDGKNAVFALMAEASILDRKCLASVGRMKKADSHAVRSNMVRTKATILASFGVKLIYCGAEYKDIPIMMKRIGGSL